MSGRVAVLGPGAVGGVLAVGLVRRRRRTSSASPARARPTLIRAEGLTLKQGENVETVRPEVATELREPVDFLLVTVKAPALDEALERVEAQADTVVPLLNGIEHMETIRGASCRTAPSSVPASAGSRRSWNGPGWLSSPRRAS